MAEGGNVPELGGYDYEFTSTVPDYWECLVCHLTMKDPVQIVGCGHRLCNICMESLLSKKKHHDEGIASKFARPGGHTKLLQLLARQQGFESKGLCWAQISPALAWNWTRNVGKLRPSPTCPADRQPLSREKIFPDAACHRQILDLTVKCSYPGCSWTGELRAVEKHLSECLFKVVECPNSDCTEKLTKQDLKIHMANECSWRKVNCEYCQESFIVNQKQEHFGVCLKFPVQCTNKCGLRDIPREKLDVHVRDECPATEVQCEYKNLGCEEMFPRSNAKTHSETQVESHLNLALRGLEVTQLQVNELVNLVKDQSQQIQRLMSNVNEQSQQIAKLLYSPSSSPFVWEIPNFKSVFQTAKPTGDEFSILSEQFYLSRYGYKYSVKITVKYKLSYLSTLTSVPPFSADVFSLHIKVVPGEFDSLLTWPCKEKVRATLIDQDPCQDNRVNISHIVDFEKGENPCCRPLNENSLVYRQFIAKFSMKTLKTRPYVKNDALFITVSKE